MNFGTSRCSDRLFSGLTNRSTAGKSNFRDALTWWLKSQPAKWRPETALALHLFGYIAAGDWRWDGEERDFG
jgi:hypothetical protein